MKEEDFFDYVVDVYTDLLLSELESLRLKLLKFRADVKKIKIEIKNKNGD
jgi:hypothetical protein